MDCCPGCCYPEVIFCSISLILGKLLKLHLAQIQAQKWIFPKGKNSNSIGLLFLTERKVCNKRQYICIMQVQLFDSQYYYNILCIYEICKSKKISIYSKIDPFPYNVSFKTL